MSLFGTTYPKLKYGSTYYTLDYSVVPDSLFTKHIVQQQTSIITGKNYFVLRGDYASFEIVYHLYKHQSATKAKFESLYELYINQYEFEFYPHNDNPNPIKTMSNTNALFRMVKLEPFYLETVMYRDALRIGFESITFIKQTGNLL